MITDHVNLLCCPGCKANLELEVPADNGSGDVVREDGHVMTGQLTCTGCATVYPVLKGVPRFIPPDNYAASFGFQWNLHNRTQYDSHSGSPVSRERLFLQTRWPEQMPGELVLEAGSGSGRFTEQLVTTDATVVSLDYSNAVEANYANNGHNRNLLVIQANMFELPFPADSFDRVLCIGVLQHTPDPQGALASLCTVLKPAGMLAVDIYRWTWRSAIWPKYYIRPFTRKIPNERLYWMCDKYINLMWPLSSLISRLGKPGIWINRYLMVPDYRSLYDLKNNAYKTWAKLDLFDMLSPDFDRPVSIPTFRRWFESLDLDQVDVGPGYNGIEGRAIKSPSG